MFAQTYLWEEGQVGVGVGLVGVRVGGLDGGRGRHRRDVLPAQAASPAAHAHAAHDPATSAATAACAAVMVVGPVQLVGGASVGA